MAEGLKKKLDDANYIYDEYFSNEDSNKADGIDDVEKYTYGKESKKSENVDKDDEKSATIKKLEENLELIDSEYGKIRFNKIYFKSCGTIGAVAAVIGGVGLVTAGFVFAPFTIGVGIAAVVTSAIFHAQETKTQERLEEIEEKNWKELQKIKTKDSTKKQKVKTNQK